MQTGISAGAYAALRPVYVGLYAEWCVLWLLVAWYYGRSAYSNWKLAGGSWGRVLGDVAAPFVWGLRDSLCRWGLVRAAPYRGTQIPSKYMPGHILRFAIFLGSLTPIMFGSYFAYMDRSHWSPLDVTVTFVAVSSSILAACYHLFLAYRSQPRKWQNMVTASVAWLLLGPPVIYALGLA
jgi:hypothetical protein